MRKREQAWHTGSGSTSDEACGVAYIIPRSREDGGCRADRKGRHHHAEQAPSKPAAWPRERIPACTTASSAGSPESQCAVQCAGACLQLMRKSSSGRGWQSRTAQAMTLRPTTVSRTCARCTRWAPWRGEPAAMRRWAGPRLVCESKCGLVRRRQPGQALRGRKSQHRGAAWACSGLADARTCTPTARARSGMTSRPTATKVDAQASRPTVSCRPPQGTCASTMLAEYGARKAHARAGTRAKRASQRSSRRRRSSTPHPFASSSPSAFKRDAGRCTRRACLPALGCPAPQTSGDDVLKVMTCFKDISEQAGRTGPPWVRTAATRRVLSP